MTQTTVGTTGFQPTPRAVERFENRVSELLDVLTDGWIEQGADPDSEDIQKARDAIAESMRVPERPQWMHPEDAIAHLASFGDKVYGPEQHLDYRDAIRTRWSMTQKDATEVTGRVMGLTPEHVRDVYAPKTLSTRYDIADRRTMLYRYFDGEGRLLYVGITMAPRGRHRLHDLRSPHVKYATHISFEWYPDRESARDAELAAIRSEGPVFNKEGVDELVAAARLTEYLSAVDAE